MAPNSFDNVLHHLLGKELYREYVINCVSDHTPTDSLGVSAHASFEGGGAACDWDLESILEASNYFCLTNSGETGQRFSTRKTYTMYA